MKKGLTQRKKTRLLFFTPFETSKKKEVNDDGPKGKVGDFHGRKGGRLLFKASKRKKTLVWRKKKECRRARLESE